MNEGAEVMTDNQFDNIVKMMMMAVVHCKTVDEVMERLKLLMRSEEEAEKIYKKLTGN